MTTSDKENCQPGSPEIGVKSHPVIEEEAAPTGVAGKFKKWGK